MGRHHTEDHGVGGKITLESILGKQSRKVWIGCIWLGTGASGRLLWLW